MCNTNHAVGSVGQQAATIKLRQKLNHVVCRQIWRNSIALSQGIEELPIPELHDGPGMDLAEWEAYLDRKTRRASKGTIRFLVDGEEFFPRFIEVINEARERKDS